MTLDEQITILEHNAEYERTHGSLQGCLDFRQLEEWLKDYQSLLAQKVIRCKDCKWFGEIGCAIYIVDDSDKPTEDDFCSFAEAKKVEEGKK